jgi:hypothetical protein
MRPHRADDFHNMLAMWRDPEIVAHITGEASTREQTWARLGYARIEDLFKASFSLSPVSSLKYTLITGTNRSSYVCAQDTALLPCSSGPGNWSHGNNEMNALAFSSLAGHLQYNIGVNRRHFQFTNAEPNLTISGIRLPSYASGSYASLSLFANVSATARRHTISGGVFQDDSNGTDTNTFNSTQTISNTRNERSSSIWMNVWSQPTVCGTTRSIRPGLCNSEHLGRESDPARRVQGQALTRERRSHSSKLMWPRRASPNGTSEHSSTRPP